MDAMTCLGPLQEVGLELAEELRKQGKADKCGGCEKPLNHARKWRSMKRLTVAVSGHGLFSWTALLCGRCVFEHEHGNRDILERLNREALLEAALIGAPTGGTA